MIRLDALPEQGFAVLGLGRSGQAAAEALLASGKRVVAWDDSPRARAAAGEAGIPVLDLAHVPLDDIEALILSPGIPHTHPAPHPIVARAQAAGIRIIGDIELLIRAQPEATCVGITGTNGKSTTTALIGHILVRAGFPCEVGGNLGPPVLAFRPLGRGEIYVLEISSYQLELTPSLRLRVAVLLNISPDHLERHGGLAGYVDAKRLIFTNPPPKATHICGIDDPSSQAVYTSRRLGGDIRVIPVSVKARPAGGVFAADGRLWDALDGQAEPVLSFAAARALPGDHNAQNACAAYAAARALGLDRETVCQAILDFPGLAHRQECILTRGNITFINDSKATNPDAAARALACYRHIYWIAGGRPKEGGLDPLFPWLDRVRHAFLIGEAAAMFADQLAGRTPVSRVGTLDAAVAAATALAETEALPEATVLLSPACASFDQFQNFEARGDAFRALVEEVRR
jgi:UDP-N-acetylmuramoylalanine--D-glutamate ligase